jgi:AcrR family transcriptional regulator
MPDSTTQKRPGKRERLIASAADLMHSQGLERTTLAEIAEAAAVPPGNVYYYFKTKDDLVLAVIESREGDLRALLASFERRSSPAARLKALAHNWADAAELVAEHGCPIGTLCADLSKQPQRLDGDAAQLFELLIDWAQDQFRAMGHRDARDLAITLLAGVQGASQLANAFKDPKLMTRQVRRLERWVDSLA